MMLHFLYTATTPEITPSTALELLDCADMLNVTDLKLHIEEYLWNFIEISNVCMVSIESKNRNAVVDIQKLIENDDVQLLNAARIHTCPRLQELCTNYILRNFAKINNLDEYNALDLALRNAIREQWLRAQLPPAIIMVRFLEKVMKN